MRDLKVKRIYTRDGVIGGTRGVSVDQATVNAIKLVTSETDGFEGVVVHTKKAEKYFIPMSNICQMLVE